MEQKNIDEGKTMINIRKFRSRIMGISELVACRFKTDLKPVLYASDWPYLSALCT